MSTAIDTLLEYRPACDAMRNRIVSGEPPTPAEYEAFADPIVQAIEEVRNGILALTRFPHAQHFEMVDALDTLLDHVAGLDVPNIAFDTHRGALAPA